MLIALIAGLGVVLAASPFGCLIVWQRMAFFGEMIAHTALLGVGLGMIAGVAPVIGVILTCIMAIMLMMKQTPHLPTDTMLGVVSHIMLAFGILFLFVQTGESDLHDVLLGDILSITHQDLIWLYAINIAALAGLGLIWRRMLLIIVSENIALAENIKVKKINLLFMLLLVPVIAFGIKIAGTLLIISLLIIPAATARSLAADPLWMALIAIIFGALSVLIGLTASFMLHLPSGASIIAAASVFFLISLFAQKFINRLMPRKI